jgi:CubicO group peptidase (beta-lactamase class C family)
MPVPAVRARALDPAFAIAARQVDAGTAPFVVLAVAGAEGIVRLDAVPADDGPRIGTNAVCLLASITKPIVATAVVRLAQAGRFPLEAPLSRWLPELDAAGLAPFTAWHVLTHTTGIADIGLVDLLEQGGDRAELIRRTIAGGQAWAPGSRFLYATFPFDLLAEAVERALGRPFEEVLRAEVLDPLGMRATTFDPARSGDLRAPIRIGNWDGTLQAAPDGFAPDEIVSAYASLRIAGGGLWGDAHDLLRFGRAMLRGGELDGVRVLGRPIVELMTREVTVGGLGAMPDRLADEHYAVGWGKPGAASPASPLAFGHGGVSGTRLWVDPAYDLVFVYLSGVWGGLREAIDEVQLAVYGSIE